MTENDALDHLLDKYPLKTVLRIGAWIYRFIYNCQKNPGRKQQGPISTQEVKRQELWWIKQAQKAAQHTSQFQADQLQLNLQLNGQQVLECRGRIIGEYPIYLPDNHPFTQKLVFQAHLATLHGGVGLTMAKVREKYWVPRLRRLVKKMRGTCNGCKRLRAKPYPAPGRKVLLHFRS